eukprot:706548_1
MKKASIQKMKSTEYTSAKRRESLDSQRTTSKSVDSGLKIRQSSLVIGTKSLKDANRLPFAWCSWCFEETYHSRVERNFVVRNIYKCQKCIQRTVTCRLCDAMARGHPDYDDQLCSVCDGTIKKWGEVPIDDVLTGRCSWCLHMSVHTRRMNNYVRRDTYRCGACDSRTAICLHCNSAFSRCDTWYDDKTCIKCQGIIPDWETQDENLRIMDAKSIEIRSANDTSEPFVPLRKGCWCRPLIDGEEFMSAVVDALDHAERVIYLCFWHLNDRIYLRRDGKEFHLKDRLDIVLQKKAQEGVQIYILLWREFLPTITLNNFSKEVKRNLSLLHDNIHIIRHGIDPAPGVSWVQHQKFVVVDEAVAFIGGLDICLGRWDTPEHRLIDPDKKFFLGVDYYNPFIGSRPRSLDGPAMFEDVVQRASSPRMPWHDVDVEVRGEVARDVAVNFVQRWNHHKRQRFFKKDEDPILEVSSLETIEASRFYRTG